MKKIIIILIVLVIAGILLFKFVNFSSFQNSSKNSKLGNPSKVVSDYYAWYLKCMKNPPAEASGAVSEYCQKSSVFTTSDFPQNIEKGGVAQAGADPILCAQNPPESVGIGSVDEQNDMVTVTVIASYGSINTLSMKAFVIQENGQWKVSNIICPKP